MKKTHKIIMGITALVVAFSAFSFTACSKQPDGTIDGNYKEATTDEINAALENVDQDKILGDKTAADYKFGIDFSSSLNFSTSTETSSSTASMKASYKMLATAGESVLSYKGAGSLSMNGSTTPAEGDKTTEELSLNLWQDNAMLYLNMTKKSSQDKEEPQPQKFKLDASALISSLIPGGTYSGNTEDATTPDLSSFNLVTIVNKLNEMGATVAMDTTNGIKLKINITKDVVNNLVSQIGETASEIPFTKCNVDLYVAIDSNGLLSAMSIVADVEITQEATLRTRASTTKLDGYLYFAVDANVNPEVPESLETDKTYIDMTGTIIGIIGG